MIVLAWFFLLLLSFKETLDVWMGRDVASPLVENNTILSHLA